MRAAVHSRIRRSIVLLWLAALAVAVLASAPASATRKVALVIGNNAYVHAPALSNPVNDAKAVARVLRGIGFDVVERHDVSKSDVEGIMEAFAERAAGADIGLVYFAGHGIQVSGATYLVPIDVSLDSDRDMRKLIPSDYFLQDASQARQVGVVILDACRDNPFIKRLSEATAQTRSLTVGRGLSRIDAVPTKGLIAYATQAGNVALDTTGGENSPYAAALVKHLGAPKKDIRLVFGAIRDEVIETTQRKQEPYTYGSLGGDPIYLNDGEAPSPVDTETAEETPAPRSEDPGEDIAFIPKAQLTTSAPVTSSYLAWKSAIAKSSWDRVTALAGRTEKSVFPILARRLLDLKANDPGLGVRQALNALKRQRLDLMRLQPELASLIQAQLRDINYYGGEVNDRIGADSKAALDAYVTDRGRGNAITAGAILALAKKASERKAQSTLTGLWRGRYYYPRELNGVSSVAFEMDLTFSQGQITGFVTEPNTFGAKTSANLYATFSGTVVGNSVEWTKTYDGTAGVNHSVSYSGTLDRRNGRIEGRWEIRNDWSGDFQIELN